MHIELVWPQITYCSFTCIVLYIVRFQLMKEIEWNAGRLYLTSNKALSDQNLQKKMRLRNLTKNVHVTISAGVCREYSSV